MTACLFDRYDSDITDPVLLEEMRGYLVRLPDHHRVIDCQPSEQERLVIATAREAIRRETARLGSERGPLADDFIHILDDFEFTMKLGLVGGKSHLRHSYLRRDREPHVLLHDALHELTHSSAFLHVHFRQFERKYAPPAIYLLPRRAGSSFVAFRGIRHTRITYSGLDEAVTDMLAHRMASRLAAECCTGALPPETVIGAAKYWAYFPAACVAAALIHRLGPLFGGRPEDARDQLFRDYFTGTTGFLRALNRYRPGATKVLAAMTAGVDSVVETAKRLGLSEALDRLADTGVSF